jgi:hypothetical protein
MSKTSFTTKANSVFLATVLVAGIIALSYPSFMIGAQAQQFNGMDQRYNSYEQDYGQDNKYNSYGQDYGQDNKYNSYEPDYGTDYGMDSYDKKPYGKDNSYDKSKDSVIVKKIKCNNININLNGFSGNKIGTDPKEDPKSELGILTAEAEDEGSNGANFGNNGRGGHDDRSSGHDSNSRFVCINHNDNKGGAGEEPKKCDDCVKAISPALRDNINDILGDPDPVTIPGTEIKIFANSVDKLCEELKKPISLTEENIRDAIRAFAGMDEDLAEEAKKFVDCLIEAGAIIKIRE